jgi:Fuc2NAc and GlcNAc transferase
VLTSGLLIAASAGLASACVLLLVLCYAAKLGLVQKPNGRSSHTRPTPTGGGIGIVAGGTIAGLYSSVHSIWPPLLITVAGLCIAGVGLVDDIRHVRPIWRILTQASLIAIMLFVSVPLATLEAAVSLPLGFIFVLLAAVYWINVFNFMDGIDGLAGMQGAFILFAATGLILATAPSMLADPLTWWFLAIGSAAVVFLAFNWQPAKIFMGDAGSTYLGFMIAVLALITIALRLLSLWDWLILAAPFVSDATVTLVRRLLQGEKVLEGHRRHAYQFLARRFRSHQTVTLIFLGINLFWIFPLALYAHDNDAAGWLTTLVAYVPLVALAFFAGAGRPLND